MTWKELKGNERKGNENINLSGKVGPLDLVPPYQSLFGSELTFLFTTPVLVSSGQSIAQLRRQFLTECRPTSLPLLRNGKPTARAIWHGKARCLSDFESETVFVSFICWCFRTHARHPGWFYVKSPPSPERSMLMGTFGTNDASTLYSGSNRHWGGVRRAISRWSPEMAERWPQIVISHPLLCDFFFLPFNITITCNYFSTVLQPSARRHPAPWRCSALSITPYWSPVFRRRHGAIWINDDGKLGMSTNTGTLLNLNWIES